MIHQTLIKTFFGATRAVVAADAGAIVTAALAVGVSILLMLMLIMLVFA